MIPSVFLPMCPGNVDINKWEILAASFLRRGAMLRSFWGAEIPDIQGGPRIQL